MKNWLIGIGVVVAAVGGFVWWAALDANAPARADGGFDIAAYRALVSNDSPDVLPTEVRIARVGVSQAPSFAAEAGNFSGERTFSYNTFQIVGPGGDVLIDGAVDADTLTEMSQGAGAFDAAAYASALEAMPRAAHVLITHEHLDHVMALARHPEPAQIAPRLRLTRTQLDAMAPHARAGALAPEIGAAPTLDFSTPQRIAPGIVAHAAPGHSPGSIVIYVHTTGGEYLFIGDIVWVMSNIDNLRGRPRFIRWVIPEVDPDRQAVLAQIRALHDLSAAEPELVLVPAHDEVFLRRLVSAGALTGGLAAQQAPAPQHSSVSGPSP